ncbi:prolyl oligopeptidase family serine peptidase [Streptomyces sp. VNUA116]|uniref:alpha/beta hydrolase family protein n=1 Tax=Streptomyces sp. VNUA116 TaxID=3062449 RepID=UPI0026766954|nr:prolyl oligopeptidase family serine peptidase [Streptomyces sp. VNUA116]WKU48828.1 prolyl oligopeptidase family serine peptidase [Streptomyces sp. VNUA116]
MTETQVRTSPYGTWTSPIGATAAAAGQKKVEWAAFVGEEVWWTEWRPSESGRVALVRRAPDGSVADALEPRWNVRTRVIEYGGRPWLPLGTDPAAGFVFTHWDDQRVYRAVPGGTPEPISPEPGLPGGVHYGDFCLVGDEVWCLREVALTPDRAKVRRDLVALPLNGSAVADPDAVRVLAASHHLMTGPKVSPDGRYACWLGWDHPRMPWDGTELMCAPIGPDGTPGPARVLAGGPGVAVSQAEWAPDRPGVLYVLSDTTGWWNLHELGLDGSARPLCPREEEFGDALWRIGAQWFLPVGGGRMFVTHGVGARRLALLEADGSLRELDGGEDLTEWAALATDGRRVVATAAGPRSSSALLLLDPGSDAAAPEVLRGADTAYADHLPPGYHEVFRGPQGEEVHAYVYPPYNPGFTAPDGELPPYVVQAHGGPTTRSQLVADLSTAFFTSRGIGVVDVQYGGSTGFGQAYRERLREAWGVVDVRDCATAIRGLAAQGKADPDRIGIRGGSAGGWTAAASLAAEPELYRVAGIYFPLLDPEEWRERGTHDFESRYLESLIGPWPRAAARYAQVSPLRQAGRVRAPFVLMQGLEDTVCPPVQAESFLERMRENGVPHAYLAFEGEQHGFRQAETVVSCLHAELSAYAQAFGFEAPGVPRTDLSVARRP